MVEPVENSGGKMPFNKGTVGGLLIGIVLAIFLEMGTVEGTALLVIICTLAGTIIWWIVRAFL